MNNAEEILQRIDHTLTTAIAQCERVYAQGPLVIFQGARAAEFETQIEKYQPTGLPALRLRRIQKEIERQAKRKFVNALEFIEQNPNESEPIVDGLFRRGEVVNAIGSTKEGKSWLILGLALSIAAGRDWMGRPVKQGRVALVDNELQPATLAKRVQFVAKEMGIDDDVLRDFVLLRSLRIEQRSLWELQGELEDIADQGIIFVGLDAFYRFLGGATELDHGKMADIYNIAVKCAAKMDAAMMFNHHSTKGDQSQKSVTDMGSGAGSISRAVDTHLVIRPHQLESCAVMEAACRSFPRPQPVTIQWDFPLWHLKDAIEPEIKRTKTKTERDAEEAEDRILRVLADGKRRSDNAIVEATGLGEARCKTACRKLASEGKINRRKRQDGRRTTYGNRIIQK